MTIYECDRCGQQSKPDEQRFLDTMIVSAGSCYADEFYPSPQPRVAFDSLFNDGYSSHGFWCPACRAELVSKIQAALDKFLERKARR